MTPKAMQTACEVAAAPWCPWERLPSFVLAQAPDGSRVPNLSDDVVGGLLLGVLHRRRKDLTVGFDEFAGRWVVRVGPAPAVLGLDRPLDLVGYGASLAEAAANVLLKLPEPARVGGDRG